METSGLDLGMLLGGIGLFLLGMMLMTEWLKASAGPALTRILEKTTNTPIKGFFSGFFTTALLQSSHATTLLAIGFVNAGILSFAGSLWLIFGANVGTTLTWWLVALIGLKIKVEIFALPIIGMWVLMKVFGGQKKWWTSGDIFSGFGILFLGISFLQASLTWVDSIIDFGAISGFGIFSVLGFFFWGLILTLIMQSSSASTAAILTLASTTALPLTEAAAAVIGANIGSSVTAMIAAIGATAWAKRAASVHVLFNIVTATVALMLLPWIVPFIELLWPMLGLDGSIATDLALFHTTFNVLWVLLMIPLAGYMSRFLMKRFTKWESDNTQITQYLDDTLLSLPSLAIESLYKELERYGHKIHHRAIIHFWLLGGKKWSLSEDKEIDKLDDAITTFIHKLSKQSMSLETAKQLEKCLKIFHYYDVCYTQIREISVETKRYGLLTGEVKVKVYEFLDLWVSLFSQTDPESKKFTHIKAVQEKVVVTVYEYIKDTLLDAVSRGLLDIYDMERILRDLHLIRSAIQEIDKASRLLDRTPTVHID